MKFGPRLKNFLMMIAISGVFCEVSSAELKVRGFADVVGSTTDSDLSLFWLGNSGRNLNMEGSSRLGLNLSADLADRWDFAGQIVGRGFGGATGEPAYIMSVDWLFLTYRPIDPIAIRVGRQILPIFLYSEQIDVGFTYLWTRLPSTLYGLVPLKSFNGLSATYTYAFSIYEAKIGLYGGAGQFNQVSPGIGGLTINDLNVKGGYLSLSSDSLKLSAAYKSSNAIGTIYTTSPLLPGQLVQVPFTYGNVQNFSLGARDDFLNFTAIAEATRLISDVPGAANDTGAYGTLAYHLGNGGYLTPHFTYGKVFNNQLLVKYPNALVSQSLQTEMTQFIAGLNLRATNSVVVKFEYERDQLNYQDSSLNFGANTFTVSVDAVF